MNYFFSAKPKIIFTASCYHYVTKTKTEYDSNGRLRNNTYEEKVITHYDTLTLPYYSSRDVSGPFVLNLKKVGNVDFVKLHLKLSIDLLIQSALLIIIMPEIISIIKISIIIKIPTLILMKKGVSRNLVKTILLK